MRRIHFFEIEDQPWCPAPVRDAATDFLQFALHAGGNYMPVAPLLRREIERLGVRRIIDLCSGGGGPWQRLLGEVVGSGGAVQVHLTDRYPNLDALRRAQSRSGGRLHFHPEPVDAMRVPPELEGFRTMFTAFHHFPPAAAHAILKDAVENRQGIGIFETTQRSVRSVLVTAIAPLLVLLATPWIRPFRWSRLFWTYVVPAVPMVVLSDGIVSCLRTYSVAELQELAEGLGDEEYLWRAGLAEGRAPVPITYLIGSRVRGAEGAEGSAAATHTSQVLAHHELGTHGHEDLRPA